VKIAVICMGNICRSPMGEVVLRERAAKAGIDLEVCSGGTGPWHVGDRAHPQSLSVLSEAGYDGSAHRARQITSDWIADHDLVLVMDRENLAAVRAMAATEELSAKVRLLREFDPEGGPDAEVPDPYGLPIEEYRSTLALVERAVDGVIATLR
jgi:protein-tyrosine phosphatase